MVTDEMVEKAADAMARQDITFANCDREWQRRTFRAALEAALSAAEPQPAPSVAVKALAWNPYRAETPFGYYEINDQRDVPESELKGRPPFLLCGSRLDYSRHPTLEAARAAAQADYEARILPALSAQVQDVAGDEEWQTVPKHPTGRMIDAVVSMVDDVAPHPFILNLYRAMLAAASAKQEG